MQHADHVRLIRDAVAAGTTWLELGSGEGAFTLALAELVGPAGWIVSVDRDAEALARQARALDERYPGVPVTQLLRDFQTPLDVEPVDGLLMANSLHFIAEPLALVTALARHVQPGGRFVLVEYDAERGNPWVPHPVSFRAFTGLAAAAGLGAPRLIGREPSRFLGSIYAAVAQVPAA